MRTITRSSTLVIFLLLVFAVTGCAAMFRDPAKEMQEYRQSWVDNHPDWSGKVRRQVLAGKISIGMTEEQVRASWGTPYDINRSVGSWGEHEQWVYVTFEGRWRSYQYLYFENGRLTSWQD